MELDYSASAIDIGISHHSMDSQAPKKEMKSGIALSLLSAPIIIRSFVVLCLCRGGQVFSDDPAKHGSVYGKSLGGIPADRFGGRRVGASWLLQPVSRQVQAILLRARLGCWLSICACL
jgi:hypothetical protein